jgi:hypothetical protein
LCEFKKDYRRCFLMCLGVVSSFYFSNGKQELNRILVVLNKLALEEESNLFYINMLRRYGYTARLLCVFKKKNTPQSTLRANFCTRIVIEILPILSEVVTDSHFNIISKDDTLSYYFFLSTTGLFSHKFNTCYRCILCSLVSASYSNLSGLSVGWGGNACTPLNERKRRIPNFAKL